MLTRKLINILKKEQGFSLAEVLVSVTMIGILVGVMASLMAQSAQLQNRLTALRVANNVMQSEVTAFESAPWDDLMMQPTGVTGQVPLCELQGRNLRTSSQIVRPTDTFDIDQTRITIERSIKWYTDGTDVTCSNAPNDRADLKVVTIKLTWYPNPSREETRETTLYISNAREPVKAIMR
jgi:prepilin-type N-terminal cleavage/methylation domain-containing protein